MGYQSLLRKYDALNRQAIADINFSNKIGILQRMNKIYKRPRIGVFAASNVAIDEIIISILSQNAATKNSVYSNLPFFRIGNDRNMNQQIANNRAINLNLQIEAFLDYKWKNQKELRTDYRQRMQTKINSIQCELREMATSIHQNVRAKGGSKQICSNHKLWQAVKRTMEQSQPLLLELFCLQKMEKINYPNQAQRALLPILINNAQILFSTANYIGRCQVDKAAQIDLFDFSLFDECCQIRESETLIALKHCKRSVFIGDPRQLQATILYHGKYRNLLLNSLFVRIAKYIQPIMLTEQYRMNPQISLFPSTFFYKKQLMNASNIEKEKAKLFHNDASNYFLPYLFFNIANGKEEKRANSMINAAEIEFIQALLNKLIQ